jgi:hypothetical protein
MASAAPTSDLARESSIGALTSIDISTSTGAYQRGPPNEPGTRQFHVQCSSAA